MMVIKYVNGSGSTHAGFATGTTHLIPADRCSWRQENTTGGGYSISNVFFYRGNDAGEGLSATNGSVELGYIGKSGRFVAISN